MYKYIRTRLYVQVDKYMCIHACIRVSRCGISLSMKLLVGVGMLIPWLSPPATGSPLQSVRPFVRPALDLDFSARDSLGMPSVRQVRSKEFIGAMQIAITNRSFNAREYWHYCPRI